MAMLAEIYMEALLVDAELSDRIWQDQDPRENSDVVASLLW
jgi:hypothetical protein